MPAAICATLPENLDQDTRDALIAQGVAPMQGLHETLNAMSDAAGWAQARARILTYPPQPLAPPQSTGPVKMVNEAEGKAWLQKAGVPVPRGKCVPASGLLAAAAELGYPVALKMMGSKLAHKTEAGAVALGLSSSDELSAAICRMKQDVAAFDADAVNDSFLVERMSPPPLAELIVSLRRDAQFGWALTLGSGGILVELVGDAGTLLLPSSPADIQTALAKLKVGHLLGGFRGRPRAELAAIADALHQLCSYVLAGDDPIAEVEINPMFVYPGSIMAVDVLLHLEDRT